MLEAAYKTLRLDRQAGPEEVRAAYVRLARRYPPEHFPDKFAQIQEAWRQLSLEENFVAEFCARAGTLESPLELAALLWGDLPELDPGPPVGEVRAQSSSVSAEPLDHHHRDGGVKPLRGLATLADLLPVPETPSDLDVLLDQIDPTTIKWRPQGGSAQPKPR